MNQDLVPVERHKEIAAGVGVPWSLTAEFIGVAPRSGYRINHGEGSLSTVQNRRLQWITESDGEFALAQLSN